MSKCIDFNKSSVKLLDGIELDDKDYPVHYYESEHEVYTKTGNYIGDGIVKGASLVVTSSKPCNPKYHDEKPHWKTEQKNLFE